MYSAYPSAPQVYGVLAKAVVAEVGTVAPLHVMVQVFDALVMEHAVRLAPALAANLVASGGTHTHLGCTVKGRHKRGPTHEGLYHCLRHRCCMR